MASHTDQFIYFVRHGQSAANLLPVFQGPDDPLTDLGRTQAELVGSYLRTVEPEVILTSTMPRAQETAEIIQRAGVAPLEAHSLFREYRPPSSLSGQPKDTPEGRAFLAGQREHFEDPTWHFADEDNYHDLHARALDVLAYLTTRSERRIVVVTHAGFLRVLLVAMLTEGHADPALAARLMRFLKPQNTGVTLCRYRAEPTLRNAWRLLHWGTYTHLVQGAHIDPAILTDLMENITSEDI